MKIKSKIVLFLLLPILATDITVSVINGFDNYNSLKLLSEEKFLAQTENIAARIGRENEGGVSVARTAAMAAQVWFSDRAASTSYIRELLGIFPSFVGASVGYEVNADLNDFRSECGLRNLRDGKEVNADDSVDSYNFKINPTSVSYDEWIAKSEGGRFAAYWNRAKGDLALEPLVDMGTSMYSAGLKKKLDSGDTERFIVTEPYLYNNKVLMVEYSAPIFNDNRFVGQVAFDKDLSNISNLVNTLKTTKSSEIFLLSSQARIIACTKNQNLKTVSISDLFTDETGAFVMSFFRDENGRLVRDDTAANADTSKFGTSYRDILTSAFDRAKSSGLLGEAAQKVSYFKDAKTKVSYCVAQSIIRPGNWVMVQIIPETEILAPVYASIKSQMIGVGIFILVIIVAFLFIGAIIRRVAKATSIAEKIAQGHLDVDVPTASGSGDETDKLLGAMSEMATQLRTFVRRIDESGAQVENSTFAIERATANCESGVKQFGESALAISHAVRKIGENSTDLAKTADSVCSTASDAFDIAENGKRGIVEVTELVNSLARNTGAVVRRFYIISERAASINSIVTAVGKVADETNLLSLNASIEAEKAGTYGIGFAVVAREIGRLAEQTGIATSDIDSIVKELKIAVESGIAEIEKFAEEVNGGVDEMERISAVLDGAISKVQSVSPQVEILSNNINSQRESVVEMSSSMASFDAEAGETTELAEQALSARERLRDSVVRLRSEINKFKFNGSDTQ